MAISLTQLNNNNILDLSTWTVGTGSVSGFEANGDAAESQRLYDTGPFGVSALVWGTYPTGNSNGDGGWNGSYLSIDNTKLYRFSVWVRRTSSTSSGNFYLGMHSNGTGDVLSLPSGTSETNPYWDYRNIGWFNQNLWYLVVGHVYPYNYSGTSAHPDSGIYNSDGIKAAINIGNTPNDCKWPSDATTAMHRTYHFYCTDNTSRLQFYSPRIEVVDDMTPPIMSLLKQDLVDPATKPIGVVYSDGSVQTSSGTINDDSGRLLSVATFTSSGTWTKPSGCKRVLVQVVGGGGGAASYNESGGAGGYAERVIDVTGIATVAITIGAGGGAVGYYAAAGDGGTSSFGTYCSASGGYGANRNAAHTGGHGGIGANGDLNILGGTGTGHGNTGGREAVGVGAASFFGAGRKSSHSTNTANLGYSAPGAGGPGGAMQAWAGSNGAAGMVVVYSYS